MLALVAGCKKPASRADPVNATAATSSNAVAPAASSSGVALPEVLRGVEPLPPPPAPCRALRVVGKVQNDAGAPVAAMDPIGGKTWVELSPGARLAVRHGPSSREFELAGPGRALPCRGGLEQVLLAEGQFTSSPGAGVRPGAEMWVVTPFAALRYGDAALTLRVEKAALSLRVASGGVTTEAQAGAGPGSLQGPTPEKRLTQALAASERVSRCEKAAQEARSRADQLLGSASDLGKLAAEQMESRRRARAECLVAEAALDRAKDSAEKTRLSDQLTAANQLWQAIPAMVR